MKTFIKVLCLIFFLTSTLNAQEGFFGSIGFSLDVLMADSDFNNGSSGVSPGISVGYRFSQLSLNASFKKLEMDQVVNINGDDVSIEVDSDQFAGGFKYYYAPYLFFGLGLHFQNVEARYQKIESSQRLLSTIDGPRSGFYFNFGGEIPLFSSLYFEPDLAFYIDDADYSLFSLEFYATYYF